MEGRKTGGDLPSGVFAAGPAAEKRSLERFADGYEGIGFEAAGKSG